MTNGVPYSLDQLQQALGYVESSNRYDVLGPPTRNGGRAYGRYQVMDFNIPSWTQQYLGQQLTPEQFLADPAAQDAVFAGRMGEYYGNSTGDPANRVRNAASLWFTGQPYSESTAGRSDGYINNQEYGDRVLRALGAPQGADAMVMNPDPQQPQGLFGGIRNFFGGGQQQPDPNAGSNTDPFANLSRSQRTMLGFAALRDAAASLEGRDSSYFNEALGGFEAAQERERLRAQGEMANRVNALQSLAALQQQAAIFAASGMPIPTALQQAIDLTTQMAVPAGGAPAGGMGGAMPVGGAMPTGGAVSGDDFMRDMEERGRIGVDINGNLMPEVMPVAGEAEMPAPADPMAELDRREAELLAQINAVGNLSGDTRAAELEFEQIQSDREALADQAQAEARAQAAAETATPQTVSTLGTVQDLRSAIQESPNLTTGFWGNILGNVPGNQAYNARALADTIGANLAFDQLAAMRAASPTGGALGSVTERELSLLQSSIANLDLAQSADQVLDNLETIENRYESLIRRAYQTTNDPEALDAAIGGRPDFMVEGTTQPQTGGPTHRYNPQTGQIEAIR